MDYKLVGVAKHICGCALDLSLRCLYNYSNKEKVQAVSMATCCHHICRVEYLNNLKFYTDYLKLSIRDIVLIFKATSWIFGPININENEVGSDTQDNLKSNIIFTNRGVSKKYIGLLSKYIVDFCRVFDLISQDFKVFYLKYCDNEVTTENNLILGIKHNK